MSPTRSKVLSAGVVALLTALVGPARAQVQQRALVYADDSGGAKLQSTAVVSAQVGALCEARLQFVGVTRDVKEVSGDRGPAQRKTLPCTAMASFDAQTGRLYEEQTAYYWSVVARDYAVRSLWVTPPNWPLGAIKMANDGVQPNVITQGSFNDACWPIGGTADGCMRVWPHEGPKMHLKSGTLSPYLVTHEYGHYAAGFVFGHMDVFGFTLPAATGDCAKLAFQEAAADMFSELVLHDARYSGYGGADGYGQIAGSASTKWPATCTNANEAYSMERPLREAFQQALWGTDWTRKIFVDWGAAAGLGMPKSPQTANRIMASAFTYGLALNRGQRVDALAASILEWLTVNEPKRAVAIRQIFAQHGFTMRTNGEPCTSHDACMSFRCDNRPGAGCVSQDGMAGGGVFCTTHQQCQSGVCNVVGGLRGTCGAVGLPLGYSCTTHPQCKSQRCDNRPTAGCVAQDGQALSGQFCTTHQQCRSGFCNVTPNKITGTCR